MITNSEPVIDHKARWRAKAVAMNNNDFIENESHTESQSCKFAAKISG